MFDDIDVSPTLVIVDHILFENRGIMGRKSVLMMVEVCRNVTTRLRS